MPQHIFSRHYIVIALITIYNVIYASFAGWTGYKARRRNKTYVVCVCLHLHTYIFTSNVMSINFVNTFIVCD